ncbi:bifunctional acetate--CoA ligase family protein/GNAT family N-acetyltransferase [bacterium]|nr:bifunctional acetate--CoA ligase family protein/GNAT family N-acetyltransferase [bacterium]
MQTAALSSDPIHDVGRYENNPLRAIFEPKTVAVIGASEKVGSVGRTVLWNLITNPFGGTVYPVNPKRANVLGIRAYPTVKDIPEPVDLAVLVTPAPIIPGLIKDCAEAGVKSAIIISAGFKEMGAPGIELERQIMEHARRSGMRIIGPNCLGVMNPLNGLNATFAAGIARPGNVAFISQSGALCTAVLDWSLSAKVGFSAFVSIGSMVDVGWGDLIDYLGNDPRTQSIVIYMESIGDARTFLSAAREVSFTKPILVIKAGRTAAAAKAAASHTGSLTGSDEVLDAAFNRCGVVRVDSIVDLFSVADVLSKQPRPRGPRMTILTNAGGPGVLATDALIQGGGELTEISKEAFDKFNAFLPAQWSRNNPVDILGDGDAERYAKSLEIAASDANTDGMLVILTPQDMSDPTGTAERLKAYAQIEGKPVLASWMGGGNIAAGEEILKRAGIPNFRYPDIAARIFNYMWRYSYNLKGIYATPDAASEVNEPNREKARKIIEDVRTGGRTILTEFESKAVLSAYGIPVVDTRIAQSEDEAVEHAKAMGFPVVLKLFSETITHKTDVGGVQLNLHSEATVRKAWNAIKDSVTAKVGAEHFQGVTVQEMIRMEGYEIILGSSIDNQFGPVMLFGTGGQLVEVFKDRALGLPPLNSTLAQRMMEQTKIYKALGGVRGRKPVDLHALKQIMINFSFLAVEQQWIKEIDINPLLASPDRLVALDARIVLHGPEVKAESLPTVAIRPYPIQYVNQIEVAGQQVLVRPIRPEDEPIFSEFNAGLSVQTVYQRFLQPLEISRLTGHEQLTRFCFVDYATELPLVAEIKADGKRKIIGVARLRKIHSGRDGRFSLLIADEWQHKGLGRRLMEALVHVAAEEGLDSVGAPMLAENMRMQAICRKLGFTLTPSAEEGLVRADLKLENK